MLFSSTTFIFLFLPAVLAAYYAARGHRRIQNILLCISSLFFYAWGEPVFVLAMLASIAVNYTAGLGISRAYDNLRACRLIIAADLIFNFGLLFVFKYLDFAIENINALLFTDIPMAGIALPVGISFFTFQAVSYVIDVYRKPESVQKSILNVALYISFFPQLIAGPVVRYETVADQIENRTESIELFSEGVVRFIAGLGKKCILANSMALIADFVWQAAGGDASWFGRPVEMSMGLAWTGAIAYTFQIFFDFSGYSDMAIGLGRMFGFRFLENFNYPYISGSITEFWRRWHISLGTWFRDYLYIPLGGSRCSTSRNCFNLAVVWLCTGIWHGANWTFISWGIMYLLLLIFERASGLSRTAGSRAAEAAKHFYTMFFVIIGWVVFRSDSMHDAASFIAAMFTPSGTSDVSAFLIRDNLFYFAAAAVCSVPMIPALKKRICETANPALRRILSAASAAGLIVIFAVSVSFIARGSYNPFIYFNF